MGSLTILNIYDYLDYHEFLHDYYRNVKKDKAYFSIRFIAGKVNLSPGYVVKVFKGQTHLGLKKIEAFADLLGLQDREKEYFTELVQFGRAKSNNEIEQRLERLNTIKGIQFRTLNDDAQDFYREWHHMALRSLLSIYPFKGKNFKKLGNMLTPNISATKVEESILLMEKLKLLQKDEKGIYHVTEMFISTGKKWISPIINQYQIKNIELGMESVKNHNKESRDISTATFTFNKKHLPALRERISLFRQELLRMSQEISNEDSVMQLNIQMFPTALIPGDNNES